MVPSSWMCMVLSSSAQASSHHAVHRRTSSTGWLRLLSTTEAMTVSVQCLDVLLLETVNAYKPLLVLRLCYHSPALAPMAIHLAAYLNCSTDLGVDFDLRANRAAEFTPADFKFSGQSLQCGLPSMHLMSVSHLWFLQSDDPLRDATRTSHNRHGSQPPQLQLAGQTHGHLHCHPQPQGRHGVIRMALLCY